MAKIEVTMPKMGESITEGTVIEWHKKPGDPIELDESLLEIGTDKVDTDIPSPVAGILAEILVPEGDVVDVGTAIALIETDHEAATDTATADTAATTDTAAADNGQSKDSGSDAIDESAGNAPDDSSDHAADASAENAADDSEGSSATGSDGTSQPAERVMIDVLMPKMGESIVEGTVLTWAKNVGDPVELDETLLEIATDKVDTEVPAPAAGTVAEILVSEGDTVDVGTPIARIASEGTGGVRAAVVPVQSTPESTPALPHGAKGLSATRHLDDGRFLSPLVRSIADAEGVTGAELLTLNGSGHDGRISKKDILNYLNTRSQSAAADTPSLRAASAVGVTGSRASHAVATSTRKLLSVDLKQPMKSPGERVEVVKMDRMRQMISEHMTRSVSTSAHVTSFAEVDVSRLVRVRERNKEAFLQREGVKLTYTPFFVFAAVEALREHPIMNASLEGTNILYKKDYHIGIAVAIGTTGLVVPVIHDAGQKNIVGLAHAAADLATRTRSKQLLPDQLQGGTFTVTNVGSLGSIMGTPIINQPQVGILATGAIKKRPVVIEDPVLGDTIGIRSMMYVSLSYDHRVVDGAMGSSFLAKFRDVLESLDPYEEI